MFGVTRRKVVMDMRLRWAMMVIRVMDGTPMVIIKKTKNLQTIATTPMLFQTTTLYQNTDG